MSEHILLVKAYYASSNNSIAIHGIIGSILVDHTLTTERYVKVLENGFFSIIMHRKKKLFQILEDYFENRILSLEFPEATGMVLAWLPYSPYLNICNSFLWVYIKQMCTEVINKPLLSWKLLFRRSSIASIFRHFSGSCIILLFVLGRS